MPRVKPPSDPVKSAGGAVSQPAPYLKVGLFIAAVTFALDQITKYAVLYGLDLATRGKIYIAPFADFVLAMNRGISYGLFPQDGELGRWVLFSVKIAASLLFLVWLRRAATPLTAAALGLLIGGALGNALDRAIQGAVIDFVSLHAYGFRWYVFNLADAAIVAGVVGLLYDAFSPNALKSPPKGGI
ncbi:MAG: signal peptidase II [Xanthobacteraceae bacterium]|nr:signal peptidase II [Xanthobacteraceae bacterium]MBX3535031.1 signal peptidase II [Xanthobacteraceae bacterium]MBX3548635.1 signal peptidase II [Xanthobacteraceae bacterium]MCW5673814.1 signal peptidase II [Xanthobacteraceae bacterium]MCW5678615.1 signal peptidase II [Xanthobacteraceae bacterium]